MCAWVRRTDRVISAQLAAYRRELAGIADHAFSRRFPLGVADAERLRGLWG